MLFWPVCTCLLWLQTGSVDQNLVLSLGEKTRLPGGIVQQQLMLDLTDSTHSIADVPLHAFYQINRDPNWYTIPIEEEETERSIVVEAGQTTRFNVVVATQGWHTRLVASTSFVLFGQSPDPIERISSELSGPECAFISLVSPKYNYWPQTGQRFGFSLSDDTASLDPNSIYAAAPEGKQRLRWAEGAFSYTPTHNKQLRRGNISGTMETVIHARLCQKTPSSARERVIFSSGKDVEAGDVCSIVDADGCSQTEEGPLEARSSFLTEPIVRQNDRAYNVTYTLLLHRSRHAHLNKAWGLAVFTIILVSAMGTTAMTLRRRVP